MGKELKIGIDLDGCVFDFVNAFNHFHNSRYGTNLREKDIFCFQLSKVIGISEEEAVRRVNEEFFPSNYFKELPLYPRVKDAIRELSSVGKLDSVSSRPKEVKKITERSICQHFENKFSNYYFTGEFGNSNGGKVDIARKIQYDFLIEDSIDESRNYGKAGFAVLLIDRPWNQDYNEQDINIGIKKVEGWDEIMEVVLN